MRFDRLTIHNLGPFADVDLDLAAITGPIVAIAGENGSGKTTFLELLAAALYRECPTRGKLLELATDRDAYLEAAVVNGAAYTLRHVVDMISRKGESHVLDGGGVPLLDAAQRREMDAWAVAHLPAPEVFFSTLFTAQGAGGFLAAKPGERKAILLRALGIEHYEQLAKMARERARASETSALVLRGRLGDVEAAAAGTDVLEAEEVDLDGGVLVLADGLATTRETARIYDAAQSVRRTLTERLDVRGRLDTRLRETEAAAGHAGAAREASARDQELATQESDAAAEAVRARAAYGAAEAEAQRTGREHEAIRAQLRDAVERAENNRALLAHAGEVRAAVARDAELAAAAAEAQRRAEAAEADARRLRGESEARKRETERAKVDWLSARFSLDAAERTVAECAGWEAAEAALPALREELAAATVRHEAAEVEARAIEEAWRTSTADRIGGLRHGLECITVDGRPDLTARATLDADDRAAVAEAVRPQALRDARAAVGAAIEARNAADVGLGRAERRAELRPRAEEAALSRDEALAGMAEADARHSLALAERDGRADDAVAASLAATEHREALEGAGAERSRLAPLVRRAAPLQDAESRLAELAPLVERLRARDAELAAAASDARERAAEASCALQMEDYVDAIRANRRALAPLVAQRREAEAAEALLGELRTQRETLDAEVDALTAAAEAAPAERPDVEGHEAHLRAAEGRLAACRERLARAREAETQARALRNELAAVDEDRADWTRLGADLGRDGLQALEVDAAGPEISELANDLLHACFGPRWTVELVTTRQSADGKRELETCDVLVTDTERGRMARVESLSGGEAVIVGEALSLSLTVVACRRMGVDRPTIIRDESGAALDAEKTRAWVRMLRRAAEMTGADKVLVVSHNPEVREMADSVLVIADGRVEVG